MATPKLAAELADDSVVVDDLIWLMTLLLLVFFLPVIDGRGSSVR